MSDETLLNVELANDGRQAAAEFDLNELIKSLDKKVISLSGSQAGITTDDIHGSARISDINTSRILQEIKEDKIIIIAGFQGVNIDGDITTLGRGGSDTSAVALAASLEADKCEIYTDVPGVLTTDPRIVKNAKLMKSISCDEMLELASLGAAVLHPRAVEIARNFGVTLIVKSSWENLDGTTLTSNQNQGISQGGIEHRSPVDGLELLENQAVVALSNIPDRPGIAADLFESLSEGNVNVDLIIQATHDGDINDIAFTVNEFDLKKTIEQCELIVKQLGGEYNFKTNMT